MLHMIPSQMSPGEFYENFQNIYTMMEHTRTDSFLNFQLTNICQKEVISEIQKQPPDVF